MKIFGLNIIQLLGILNLILLLYQLMSGLRFFKFSFKIHKFSGILLVISAVFHAILAFMVS